jgi:FkbM family methyltransferase
MNRVVQTLQSSLRGTWIHHAVWTYRHPPQTAQVCNDGKQLSIETQNANYDRQTVEVMFQVLRRNLNGVDVGAHAGDILQRMVNIAPRGRHYAFEPLPHLAQELSKRFPQVIVHQAAVGDRSGESEFLFVENDPAYSGLRRRIYSRPDPKISPIRVRVVTLDEVIPPNESIAFIKLDIEGGEFHAIQGAIETIRRSKPVIVFESGSHSIGQYGVKPEDVYRFMAETLGYELSTMERWLKRKPPYTREEYENDWNHGPEYYFIATPAGKTRHSKRP